MFALGVCITGSLNIAKGQTGIVGNCDYPDSMAMNKEYVFVTSNDTLAQTVALSAIGTKQIRYEIDLTFREQFEHYEGIADWAGCFGPVTENNVMYVQNWDYRSKDGLLIISLYGKELDRLRLEMATISEAEMKRK